jgi:hypothetical protein
MTSQDNDYIVNRGHDGYYVKQQVGTERRLIEGPIESKDAACDRARLHAAESGSGAWFERPTGTLESLD